MIRINVEMDGIKQKGTKLHQPLPNVMEQIIFLQENNFSDSPKNCREFPTCHWKKFLQSAKESTLPFPCIKMNHPMKFGNS